MFAPCGSPYYPGGDSLTGVRPAVDLSWKALL